MKRLLFGELLLVLITIVFIYLKPISRIYVADFLEKISLFLFRTVSDEDLNGNRKKEQKVPQKAVIGIGAGKNYTLYDVGTDNTQFVKAGYKSEKRIKGFGKL